MLKVVNGVAYALLFHAVILVHFKEHDGNEPGLPVVAVNGRLGRLPLFNKKL